MIATQITGYTVNVERLNSLNISPGYTYYTICPICKSVLDVYIEVLDPPEDKKTVIACYNEYFIDKFLQRHDCGILYERVPVFVENGHFRGGNRYYPKNASKIDWYRRKPRKERWKMDRELKMMEKEMWE